MLWRKYFIVKSAGLSSVFIRVSRICNFVEFHHGELTSPVVIKNKLPEKISEFSVKKWAVAGHFKFSKESAQKYKEKYGNLVFCILCCKIERNHWFCIPRSICLLDAVLSIPILLWFMTFYVIWWIS